MLMLLICVILIVTIVQHCVDAQQSQDLDTTHQIVGHNGSNQANRKRNYEWSCYTCLHQLIIILLLLHFICTDNVDNIIAVADQRCADDADVNLLH